MISNICYNALQPKKCHKREIFIVWIMTQLLLLLSVQYSQGEGELDSLGITTSFSKMHSVFPSAGQEIPRTVAAVEDFSKS